MKNDGMLKPPARKVAEEVEAPKRRDRGGRPRIYSSELPVYDSMEQCSAATKVPIEMLKHAKRNGCLFVRHGRVHFSEFVEWFFNRDTDEEKESGIDWATRDKRASALIREVNLEKAREQVIDFSEASKFVRTMVSVAFFGELERLANEFPANLKGKDEVGIAKEVDEQIAIIRKSLTAQMESWIRNKGK